MKYLIVELKDNRVISAYAYDDEEETESMFVNILMDYGILITDDIMENRIVELDDGYTVQLVEAEEY